MVRRREPGQASGRRSEHNQLEMIADGRFDRSTLRLLRAPESGDRTSPSAYRESLSFNQSYLFVFTHSARPVGRR